MIKQTKKKITFDGEICCSWTYKKVRYLDEDGYERFTDIDTSVAIHSMNIKGCRMKSNLDEILKNRNNHTISKIAVCDESWGTIYIEMNNDIITLSLFDCDSYEDETEYFYEDGIQEVVDFVFTKKQTKQFFDTLEKLLN